MNGKQVILIRLSAVVVLIALLILLSKPQDRTGVDEPLLVYCAAGIKPPVLQLAQDFEKEYGIEVQLQYGGSGTLLSNSRYLAKAISTLPAMPATLKSPPKKVLLTKYYLWPICNP